MVLSWLVSISRLAYIATFLTIFCLLLNFLHVLCICFNQSARYLVDLNSKPLSFLRHCIKEYNCIQKRSVEKRFNDFVFTENICRCTISIELSGLFSFRYIVSVFPFIFAVLDFFLFFQHVRFDSVFLQFPGFVAFSCVVWFCFLWTMCLLPFFFSWGRYLLLLALPFRWYNTLYKK